MERSVELSWDQRTGDVDVIRVDGPEERVLLGVVKDIEELEVHQSGKVVLFRNHEGITTVYNVRTIRYIGPMPQQEVREDAVE